MKGKKDENTQVYIQAQKGMFRGQRSKIAVDPDCIFSIPNEVTEDVIKPFDIGNDVNPVKDLEDLIMNVKAHYNPGPYYFFTTGTGIPDKAVIKCFKNNNKIIVVDRKQRMWRKGKRIRGMQ